MAVAIVAKTAPTGKKVGDSINLVDLFTFTDSTAVDYTPSVVPAGGATFTDSAVKLAAKGSIAITLTNKTTNTIKATVTLAVTDVDTVKILETDFNKGGQITIGVVVGGSWDGKWKLELSPDGNTWIGMGEYIDKTDNAFANLSYLMPFYRFTATSGSKGTCDFYAFGPGVQDIK